MHKIIKATIHLGFSGKGGAGSHLIEVSSPGELSLEDVPLKLAELVAGRIEGITAELVTKKDAEIAALRKQVAGLEASAKVQATPKEPTSAAMAPSAVEPKREHQQHGRRSGGRGK